MSQKSLLGRHRQLAPTASVRVSPLCLGTMTFGEAQEDRYGKCDKATSFAILDTFFNNGGQFIDTANFYRNEDSERWVGEWMKERGNRDEIVLATKYTGNYVAYTDKQLTNYGGNGLKSMKLSLEASLKKLQTDYVDIFYVHWWDFTANVAEVMHGLDNFVRSGKVLYLGISDSPAWIVTKANQYARDHGLSQFVIYQGLWSAAKRDFERDILPMAMNEGMALAVYGALNQGRFQTAEELKRREAGNHGGRSAMAISQLDKDVSKVLEEIATAKGTGITSVALAYILDKAPYVFPIVGGRKVEHLTGNIESLGISLSDEEIKRIESAYHFDHGFPHTFLSGTQYSEKAQPKGIMKPDDLHLTRLNGTIDWVQPPAPIKPQRG